MSDLPNLFEFLAALKSQTTERPVDESGYLLAITPEQLEWLESFLQPADHEIHFKARILPGGDPDNPTVAQDYMIAGSDVNVFCLLTEAMLQNTTFALTVQRAALFYQEHVPTCEDCKKTILEAQGRPANWIFKPHNP